MPTGSRTAINSIPDPVLNDGEWFLTAMAGKCEDCAQQD
jgi:hypothetical protein